MSKYVDADKLVTHLKDELEGCKNLSAGAVEGSIAYGTALGLTMSISFAETLPTDDVVEVVRCKDCVHWGGVAYGYVCRKFSGINTKICMGADHYCSYGERREK